MTASVAPRALPSWAKRKLRVLLVARHALGDGASHASDGTHATYHREMRLVLEEIGVALGVRTGTRRCSSGRTPTSCSRC